MNIHAIVEENQRLKQHIGCLETTVSSSVIAEEKLKDKINSLEATVSSSVVKEDKLKKENNYLQIKIAALEFRLSKQLRARFASQSEKAPYHQLSLPMFDEADDTPVAASITVADEELTVASYTRKKKTGRKPLPKDLPRTVIIHDLPDDHKHCRDCQSALVKIGEERSEQLEYIPAQVKVIEQVRYK